MTKHRTVLAAASLTTLQGLFAQASVARADIFQWEYINPVDPAHENDLLERDGSMSICFSGLRI